MHQKSITWCTVPEIWSQTDRIFYHFEPSFALLPPNDHKNQILKKKKKMPREIILLHMCTKNEDHMITDASKRISIPVCPENEIYTVLYIEIFNAGYVSFF